MLDSGDVLFVGRGTSVVSWYRTGMPSYYNGCDWVAVGGEPPEVHFLAGLKRGGLTLPDFADYRVVVLQQVGGIGWMNEIYRLKQKGIKVLYEIDDYVQGVRRIEGHAGAKSFSQKRCRDMEACMKMAHGLIVSTPFLAQEYAKFNERVFVCKNAIEGSRYEKFTLPLRDKLHIGWAGGEGHQESVKRWLPAVQNILNEYDVRFITIGLPYATKIDAPGRTTALPFVPVENVPAVLCNMDIAIAPAGRGKFFRAKSDLRFLETGALGIPLVADPYVYDDIEDGHTGLLATSAETAEDALRRLIESEELRKQIGANAREYVLGNRSIEQARSWVDSFLEVTT